MRMPHSLKSTHWVTWSSPLLLLVLVFTLTASNSTPRVIAAPPATTTSRVTTDFPSTTTSTLARVIAVTTTTTSTTLASRPLSTVPSTNAPSANSSSNEIASSVKPVAFAHAVNATSGALTGRLQPSFEVADVPLEGPGTWLITTSSPARTSVQCANLATRVQTQIVVGSKESCQLIIRAISPETTLTWQLTPVT